MKGRLTFTNVLGREKGCNRSGAVPRGTATRGVWMSMQRIAWTYINGSRRVAPAWAPRRFVDGRERASAMRA